MPLAFPVEDWPLLPRRPFASACPKAALIGMVSTPGTVWLCIRISYSQLCSLPAPPSKTGFVRSKAKAMDPEIARNQNYDDHYANDSEDVHSVLLPFHDDTARRARSTSKYKSFLSPPPISPIAAPSE